MGRLEGVRSNVPLGAAQPLFWQPGSRRVRRASGCTLCSVTLGCCGYSHPPPCGRGGSRATDMAGGAALPVTRPWTLMLPLIFLHEHREVA